MSYILMSSINLVMRAQSGLCMQIAFSKANNTHEAYSPYRDNGGLSVNQQKQSQLVDKLRNS